MPQFTLQFIESGDSTVETAPQVDTKSVGIISRCNRRRRNGLYTDLCYVLSGIPEPINCPCPYFFTDDKEAVKKFNNLCLEYKCKAKIKRDDTGKVTYWDMKALDRFRGGKRDR